MFWRAWCSRCTKIWSHSWVSEKESRSELTKESGSGFATPELVRCFPRRPSITIHYSITQANPHSQRKTTKNVLKQDRNILPITESLLISISTSELRNPKQVSKQSPSQWVATLPTRTIRKKTRRYRTRYRIMSHPDPNWVFTCSKHPHLILRHITSPSYCTVQYMYGAAT